MSNETPEFIASVRINENDDDIAKLRHCERTFRSNRGLNHNTFDHASKT